MSDTSPRSAPLALWRVAHRLVGDLFALFGEPQAIAAMHWLDGKTHKMLSAWVRGAEAMLRQLLLIEAAHAPASNTPIEQRGKRVRVRRLIGFWPDKPEDWRVSFRFPSPIVARCARATSPVHGGRKTFRSAWPLAERAEAILRVLNDPAPFAARLARRLRRVTRATFDRLRAPPDPLPDMLDADVIDELRRRVDETPFLCLDSG